MSREVLKMKKNFFCSMCIGAVLTTGLVLMPLVEYNSSRYIGRDTGYMVNFSLDEKTVDAEFFGKEVQADTAAAEAFVKKLSPLVSFVPAPWRAAAAALYEGIRYIEDGR